MIYRQGDVLVRRVADLPKKVEAVVRDANRIVLAYGEVTGHAHSIAEDDACLYRPTDGDLEVRFLEVLRDGGVELTHQEHDTITLPPGIYEVTRQREYSPEAIRNVAD